MGRVSASSSPRFEVRAFAEQPWQGEAFIVRDAGGRHAWRREGRDPARSLAGEQAEVRRLAMAVAQAASPTGTVAAFAREVGQLLAVDATYIGRYEPDGNVNRVGGWSKDETKAPVARRSLPDGTRVTGLVWRSRRSARMDGYDRACGETAVAIGALGVRSSVGAPIFVDGDLWGVMVVSSRRELLPTDTESRLAAFTALLAMSISTAEARSELVGLAREHAALRRVASLVARGVLPCELFAAVTEEVGMLLGVDLAGLIRYEADNALTAFAAWPAAGDHAAINGHWQFDRADLAGRILATGRSARMDTSGGVPGRVGEFMPERLGVVSSVGAPIVVAGGLWGALLVHSRKGLLPPDTEARLEGFTELVSAAVSSIQARRELATSRARLVAAGDEQRRRVIRDLHDGAQQRLVHTVVALRLAREALQDREEASLALVAEALDNAQEAISELRELAHGILPSVVARAGLRGGVRALASRMSIPVEIGVSVDRLPSAVEATAYFVVAEALTNITKHSGAEHAEVIAAVEQDTLYVQVFDDGVGGARLDGSGLAGLADRLAAIDGGLRIESPAGGGTLVLAELPVWG